MADKADKPEYADPLAPFAVTLIGKRYILRPRKDLEIPEDKVDEMKHTQPTMFAYYAAIADEAQNVVDALQARLQQKESELYDRLEEELGKTPSEDKAKKYIRGHEEYIEIQENLVDANRLASKLRSLTNAFVDRRFMLTSLSGKQSQALYQEGQIKTPKPVAVSEYRTVGAHPSRKGK